MINDRRLIKRFCKKRSTKYLEKMSPNVIQYFNLITESNEDVLFDSKVAKKVREYFNDRVLRDLKTIEEFPEDGWNPTGGGLVNLLPNMLPVVLEQILTSMNRPPPVGLGGARHKVRPYTKKQLIIYNYCKNLVHEQAEQPSPDPAPETTSCKLNGLKYNANSCYMDSTLLALFGMPNKTISDNILNKDLNELKTYQLIWTRCNKDLDEDIKGRQKIQRGLIDVTMYMRGLSKSPSNCKPLRLLLKNCIQAQPFHGNGTQDAGEFLVYLFNMFQVNVATTFREIYGSNDLDNEYTDDWILTSRNREINDSVIVDIVSTSLMDNDDNYDITNYIDQTIETTVEYWKPYPTRPQETFIRKREIFRFEESPIIIFKLDRTYGEPSFEGGEYKVKTNNIWKKVIAPEFMLLNNKKLYLSAIVVHSGSEHYVCNVKCENEWFFYDDMYSFVRHTGSYSNMLKTKPDPMSHGTIYFYT